MPDHAQWIEDVEKIVLSRTLDKDDWKNTKIIKDNIADEITMLKNKKGKNLMIFGSPSVCQTFMNLGLVDELRLTINPVILAEGKPLFKNIDHKSNLKLLNTKLFKNGNIAVHYEVLKK